MSTRSHRPVRERVHSEQELSGSGSGGGPAGRLVGPGLVAHGVVAEVNMFSIV
ncbi:hypothetical protein GS885_22280 [Rhodococcus hoagii]|nr:hypothetical protein [Prescottella equi]NKT60739.1 hypothetical protein [Prescottella equi]